MKKGKAIVVGGSIAGVSCAHALISSGWEVVVIEKSSSPPQGSPTGAGLALDLVSVRIINSWLDNPQSLLDITFPMRKTQARLIDKETKVATVLVSAVEDYRGVYWSILHCLLYNSLPQQAFRWGHTYQSFRVPDHDKNSIMVQAKNLLTDEIVEIEGNLLIGADGCHSSVRCMFLPDHKLRYSGYCAWRGIYDFSTKENSEIILNIRKAYPDLGKGIYFEQSVETHTVFYELPDKKFNWIWFVNKPEPDMKGNSMTMKVTEEMVQQMHQEAEKIWTPEFVEVIEGTEKPFINFIYDSDPLKQFVWGNVVLVGEAAHATTPHGARSTNMAILDADVLGKCLEKYGVENIASALQEYQNIRLPITAEQVLLARRMGQTKQGLRAAEHTTLDPETAKAEAWRSFKIRETGSFSILFSITD